jgi:hypothetical protein
MSEEDNKNEDTMQKSQQTVVFRLCIDGIVLMVI